VRHELAKGGPLNKGSTNAMPSIERELDLLESIQKAIAPQGQRDLARTIGMSLGMTNSILKRMGQKGWLTIRKLNSRNIQYIVSAKGLEVIARRSYKYLRRTIGHIVRYKETFESLVRDARKRGCRQVILVGKSDLDFLVEHSCSEAGLPLQRVTRSELGQKVFQDKTFVIFAEGFRAIEMDGCDKVFLRNVLPPYRVAGKGKE
jgi:hypothetical protein